MQLVSPTIIPSRSFPVNADPRLLASWRRARRGKSPILEHFASREVAKNNRCCGAIASGRVTRVRMHELRRGEIPRFASEAFPPQFFEVPPGSSLAHLIFDNLKSALSCSLLASSQSRIALRVLCSLASSRAIECTRIAARFGRNLTNYVRRAARKRLVFQHPTGATQRQNEE